MNPAYLPQDRDGKLAHLSEESAEVIAEIGKIQRFGLHNVNPHTGESNRNALLRELDDLEFVIARAREAIT